MLTSERFLDLVDCCCPKCKASQILAPLVHRLQVKPGSKHRYDWDIPDDTRWPSNPLVGGHLTLKKVTELSQKDSSIWSFITSVVPQLSFTDSVVAKKSFASDDYSSCLLTWNLQVECLLKVKTKMSHSMAWCLKFWILWSYWVRSSMSNYLQIPCAKNPLAMNSFSHYRSRIPLASVFFRNSWLLTIQWTCPRVRRVGLLFRKMLNCLKPVEAELGALVGSVWCTLGLRRVHSSSIIFQPFTSGQTRWMVLWAGRIPHLMVQGVEEIPVIKWERQLV